MQSALSLVLSLAIALAATATPSCHRGTATPAAQVAPFEVVAMWPVVNRTLDLPVWVLFTDPVEVQSLTADSLRIEAIDGPGVGTPVRGTFAIRSLGDGSFADSIVAFVPELPMGDGSLIAGLAPDTRYSVTVPVGGVRSRDGRAVGNAASYTFRTVAGSSVRELFGAGPAGGPRVVSVAATPRDGEQRVQLGRFAQGPVTVSITFDQPLEVTSTNVPMQTNAGARGAVWLEYDDPEYGPARWLDCAVAIERNAYDGSTVTLRPRRVLPSAAALRVVVRGDLRDITGESDAAPALDRVVATLPTEAALLAQRDVATLALTTAAALDAAAGSVEPGAAIDADGLRAGEAFPRDVSGEALGDWEPTVAETVLDTDRETLTYRSGVSREVHGGVFFVRHLRIPADYVVRGRGSQPLVFVVDGDARIDGELNVRGEDGWSTGGQYRGPGDNTPAGARGSLQLREHAGRGRCGGHSGGSGSLYGGPTEPQNGRGSRGTGGRSGAPACPECRVGSGGGGGSFSTAGDPGYPTAAGPGTVFAQRLGQGGYGCGGASGSPSRSLTGGAAGQPWFADARADNDFFGTAYDPRRALRVQGELPGLVGGAGGAAGGNQLSACPGGAPSAGWWGGAGGAGGGVVVLRVRGRIEVGPRGRIVADGGHGVASGVRCGGGGGSGGMIVLQAGERIVLHTHGDTFANRDYDFCLSADGGISRENLFQAPSPPKYPANGEPTMPGSQYDAWPRGGLGGLGLIQLMTPVGIDNDDGTNTVLDDNIDIVQDGVPLRATAKMRYLAWRGLADDSGGFVDDFGNPTGFAYGEGDLRPSPILMPVPFASLSRARSAWLPLGAVDRRPLAVPDGGARGVLQNGGAPTGPDFAGDFTDDGWLRFEPIGTTLQPGGPRVLAERAAIASIDTATDAGGAVYVVTLRDPVLGDVPDRLVGALAELVAADGGVLARLRVRAHGRDELRLVASVPLPPRIATLQLVWFPVDLSAATVDGYVGADARIVPRTNARIGFAFHRAPERALRRGLDVDRFPPEAGTFVHRLDDPAVAAQLRAFRATHVQWEVVIDARYRRTPLDQPPDTDPAAFAIRAVWLPFRF